MEYAGLDIETSEKVYQPSDDSFLSAEMVMRYLDNSKKERLEVLDVGTGTGIIGLAAAMSDKVARVVFVDVDENALGLSRKNFETNRKKIKAVPEFISGDLLSEIPGNDGFDMIIFNAPYLRNEKEGEDAEHNPWSGGAAGIEISVKFLEQSLKHLKKDGVMILNASSLGNLEMLMAAIRKMSLKVVEKKSIHIFFEDILSLAISKK